MELKKLKLSWDNCPQIHQSDTNIISLINSRWFKNHVEIKHVNHVRYRVLVTILLVQ